jgi:hypothetical protein
VFLNGKDVCLRKAFFSHTPIEKNADVVGIIICSKLNLKNNCKFKQIWNFNSFLIRRWLKKDCKKRGISYGKK